MTNVRVLLAVGDVVHGFCQGVFGRDHYDCSVVEALGPDWGVVRTPGGEHGFAAGHDSLNILTRHRGRNHNYYGDPCCEPGPAAQARAQTAAANNTLAPVCNCGRTPDPGICPTTHSEALLGGGHCVCVHDGEEQR